MEQEELRIYKYGEPVLAARAEKITDIDDRLVALVKAMGPSMVENNGIGLAAPQIGLSIQLAVIDLSMGEDPDEFLTIINPEILEAEGSELGDEGCLSVPGISLAIDRKTRILLKATDLQGNEFKREYTDYKARVLQHEIDHLHGKVILDRVSQLKRQIARRQIRKLKHNGEW